MPWLSLTIRAPRRRAARLATCPSAHRQRSRSIEGAQSRAACRFGCRLRCPRNDPLRRHGGVAAVDLALFKRYARRTRGRSKARVATAAIEADMTTFDKRKEGFEQKFAHDEELKFK